MKRLLSITAALFIAALFALPTAAIANLDGSEPVFDGDAGIMPLADTVEVVGEPTDELFVEAPENQNPEVDRSSLARSEGTPNRVYVAVAAFALLGLVSTAALALSIIALVKANRGKTPAEPKIA